MDSSDRAASPVAAASTELPVLLPEFPAPLKLGRCAATQEIDPITFQSKPCPTGQLDLISSPPVSEQFKLKPYTLTKEDEAIDRTLKFNFKLESPPPSGPLDLRVRIDQATSFDVDFDGRAGKVSLNPRKCGSSARAGFCLKVGF